jgi:hypothetical protein
MGLTIGKTGDEGMCHRRKYFLLRNYGLVTVAMAAATLPVASARDGLAPNARRIWRDNYV